MKFDHRKCLFAVFAMLLLAGSIAEAKTYRLIRSLPNRVPLNFMDSNGQATGLESEVMKEIIKRAKLDVKEEFVSSLTKALQKIRDGEADLAMSAASITKEREKEFDFSEPYFQTGPVAIITTDKNVEDFVDLSKAKVGAMLGSTHEKRLRALQQNAGNKGEIKTADTVFLALKDVIQGKTIAVVGDESYMFGFMDSYQNHNLRLVVDKSFNDDDYGIVIKKGDAELKAKLDAALQEMKKDGSLQKMVQKWYPKKQ